jgi:hypothetical protein
VHASVIASQFLPLEERDRRDFHRRIGRRAIDSKKNEPDGSSRDSYTLQAQVSVRFGASRESVSNDFDSARKNSFEQRFQLGPHSSSEAQ